MSHNEEIEKAIAGHAAWKIKLRRAVTDGQISISVENIRADNRCDFGKWLQTPAASRDPAKKAEVAKLHTEFHRVAAKVADLALHGKGAEASALMAPGGEYAVTSSKLTVAMMSWKKVAA